MTYQGGWQNYYQTSYESPPSRPESDSEIQILGTEEGRFRCIRRKDGQLDTVIWEYKTTGTEEMYAVRRCRDAQRDQLRKMDQDEIKAELRNRSELTQLSWQELFEAYLNRCEECEESKDNLNSITSELVQTIARREGPKDALEEYRKLQQSSSPSFSNDDADLS